MGMTYSKVSLITVNWCMQNTAISKKTHLNRAMVINSINGLNNIEMQANDAHGMAASEQLFRLRRFPQFDANNFFSANNS